MSPGVSRYPPGAPSFSIRTKGSACSLTGSGAGGAGRRQQQDGLLLLLCLLWAFRVTSSVGIVRSQLFPLEQLMEIKELLVQLGPMQQDV